MKTCGRRRKPYERALTIELTGLARFLREVRLDELFDGTD